MDRKQLKYLLDLLQREADVCDSSELPMLNSIYLELHLTYYLRNTIAASGVMVEG